MTLCVQSILVVFAIINDAEVNDRVMLQLQYLKFIMTEYIINSRQAGPHGILSLYSKNLHVFVFVSFLFCESCTN